jgi:P27 family predicted phage terminase small subunit
MPGRLPTVVKVLQGTARQHRLKREPQHPVGDPRPPAWLGAEARAFWDELVPVLVGAGVMTTADRHALALTCSALAEHRAAMAVLDAGGSTYEAASTSGAVLHRERPEVRTAADAWRRAMRGLCEFGLSPASRGRIDVEPVTAATRRGDPTVEFFDD